MDTLIAHINVLLVESEDPHDRACGESGHAAGAQRSMLADQREFPPYEPSAPPVEATAARNSVPMPAGLQRHCAKTHTQHFISCSPCWWG
jgi:glycine/D-amino acid oxidase-like deaminating enzyme